MERLLLKIQELEREAQCLIDKEPGSDSIPSTVQQQQQQQQEQEPSPNLVPKCKDQVQQRRFSPRLSTAAQSHVVLEDGNQTPKDQPTNQNSTSQEPHASSSGVGDGDWVREMRHEAGRWNGNKLVVLSLFDGIGGVWAALTRLGVPFQGYSSEVSAPAVEVVKARFPEVQRLGDVRKLKRSDIGEDVDLLVGGFPCQDLSCMGRREGLHGQRSRLFFDLLEAVKVFQPKWFLVENVASMSWIDRLEISKYTGVRPLELDSIELTPTRRRRLYWTNIPHPPRLPRVRDHPSTLVQSCLQNATALEEKTGVILGTTSEKSNSYNVEKAFVEGTDGLRELVQAEVERMMGFLPNHTDVRVQEGYNNYYSTRTHDCQLELVMERGINNSLRYIGLLELELLMGYHAHHTGVLVHEGTNSLTSLTSSPLTKDKNSKAAATTTKRGARKCGQLGGDGDKSIRKQPLRAAVRWLLLGNTFSVQVIAYLLSPLLKRSVRDLGQLVHISRSTLEKDCSVMEVGDVWALYNGQERPNWYALIVKRTGDRFSSQKLAPSGKVSMRLPLHVEMQYLEITPAYSTDEEDKWNPLRGTGLYEARPAVDIQESWTAFSHRVTSFIRRNNKVFVFPGKHELWTVYCRRMWSPFFVYVMESTINIGTSLSSVHPNAEGFSARCYLVIKTGEHETYRRTEKVLELEDLSIFCFQVPYSFKQQADLLKVEIGTGGRRSKKIERHIRKMQNKRKRDQTKPAVAEPSSNEEEKEEAAFNEVPNDAVADVVGDSPPKEPEPEPEQECVLEVDLRCHCRNNVDTLGGDTGEHSDSGFDISAGEIIILDDDDDDEEE